MIDSKETISYNIVRLIPGEYRQETHNNPGLPADLRRLKGARKACGEAKTRRHNEIRDI